MIKCLLDMTVSEDSKCAKCCMYCSEKETCECSCHLITDNITETGVLSKCLECEWEE